MKKTIVFIALLLCSCDRSRSAYGLEYDKSHFVSAFEAAAGRGDTVTMKFCATEIHRCDSMMLLFAFKKDSL